VLISITGQQVLFEQNAVFLIIIMKYFQVLYPNNSISIVLPCVASEQEKVIELLCLIQSRKVDDPFALDLMAKLAAMLPRCDVKGRGFKLYCTVNKKRVPLPKESLEAIFYGSENEPCLITQIHALTPRKDKVRDKVPLKLSKNMIANLVAQLIAISRDTGCNATDLMHQYSLSDLDDVVRDYSEMCRPYDDRVEERLQEMWESDHASKMTDPDFLFNLSLGIDV
jgi:hypothetical protein